MKKAAVMTLLLIASFGTSASAGTLVVVDRDAVKSTLRAGRRQVRILKRLSEGDRELLVQVRRMRGILRRLARQVRHAPVAAPAGHPVVYPAPVLPAVTKPALPVLTVAPPGPAPEISLGPQPIDEGSLARLVRTIQAEHFPREKVAVLTQATKSNHFTVAQAARLLKLFTFDRRRLAALSALAPRLVDPAKAFTLPGAFRFSSSKAQAREILGRNTR